MAIIDVAAHTCAVCGEIAEYNEVWNDWVCEMCASDNWKDEIKRRVAAHDGGVTIQMILQRVSQKTGLTTEEICMPTRKRAIVEIRQVAMTMAAAECSDNYGQIGIEMGGFDHSTVSHAIKTVRNLMQTNTKFKEKWEGIKIPPEQLYEKHGKSGKGYALSTARKKKEKTVCGK